MAAEDNSVIQFRFIGVVVKDKGENDWDIEVYPMEIVPNYTGDLSKKDIRNVNNTDSFGQNVNVNVNKDRKVLCRWLPLFDTANRVSPPSVRAGERVLVINFGDTDQYYWSNSIFPDSDLRKLENRVIHLSNKQDAGEASLDKGYYTAMDTYNKFMKIHTSDNDGEFTTYDMEIRTRDGMIKIWDGKNNYIQWDSTTNTIDITTQNHLVINTTNTVEVNTKDATVNASNSITANTKLCTVNANDKTVINTNVAEVNANQSATIKTNSCRIDSAVCQIN